MADRKRSVPTTRAATEATRSGRDSTLDPGWAGLQPDAPVSDFEYEVARLAWEKGLAESSIVREVFPEERKKKPEHFMKVRRALEKAVSHGLLQLKPPRIRALEQDLVTAFPTLRVDHVHVARDRLAACLAAARHVAEAVDEFLYRSDKKEMIIANAGGKTVGETVRYLQRLIPVSPQVPVPPQAQEKTLTFLSLNSAEIHDQFDQCANFISVRLAEIYASPDTHHFAVANPFDERTMAEYREKLQNIDLVISSAGGREAFLSEWLRRRRKKLPREAVGDVAFHLIDARGKPVQLSAEMKELLEVELARAPQWEDLTRLFRHDKVLLVLAGDKLDVSYALVESGLAQKCIFDAQVAQALLDHHPVS